MGSCYGGDHAEPRQRRAGQRVSSAQHPSVPGRAEFVAKTVTGTGQVPNISVSGALLGDVSQRLDVGTEVDLYFPQPDAGNKLHAIGRVVRQAESGFAVLFLWLDLELRGILNLAVQEAEA